MSKLAVFVLALFCLILGPAASNAQDVSLPDLEASGPVGLGLEVPADLKRPKIQTLESAQALEPSRSVIIKPLDRVNDRVCYRSLVFEQPALERFGQCQRWQDLRSGALFMTNVVLYPIHVARGHSRRCQCTPE